MSGAPDCTELCRIIMSRLIGMERARALLGFVDKVREYLSDNQLSPSQAATMINLAFEAVEPVVNDIASDDDAAWIINEVRQRRRELKDLDRYLRGWRPDRMIRLLGAGFAVDGHSHMLVRYSAPAAVSPLASSGARPYWPEQDPTESDAMMAMQLQEKFAMEASQFDADRRLAIELSH